MANSKAAPSTTLREIAGILPETVVVESLPISLASLASIDLYPEEMDAVLHAVPARKLEFAAGRECARAALRRLGKTACSIPSGSHREPLWPKGIVGSITHDGSYAIAALSHTNKISQIGIDLTKAVPLDRDLISLICRPEEIAVLDAVSASTRDFCPFKLVFSLKEALFKCLFPMVGVYFDFLDVRVQIAKDGTSAQITLVNRQLFSHLNFKLQARYSFYGDYLFTAVWIEQA